MQFPLYCIQDRESFSEMVEYVNEVKEESKKRRREFSHITLFFATSEAEDEFIRIFVSSSKFFVMGVAEQEELLTIFRTSDKCRGFCIQDNWNALDIAHRLVHMIPTPFSEIEGDWDGTVVLRRPSASSLAMMSACAWMFGWLFLVNTVVDPTYHLCSAVLVR